MIDYWGLAHHNDVVYVPDDRSTRMEILRVNYDDP
jgi:hypothetical protein